MSTPQIPAGTYTIDPSHSSVEFQIRHLGLSKVKGGFGSFAGDVTIGDDVTASAVSVTLDVDSFTTGNADRDGHVKSADFLDAATNPTITFTSTAVRPEGSDWKVDGELTISGTTRPVVLDVDFEGAAQDPWGNSRIAFSGATEIDRDEFGVAWNQALETGGLLLGKTVKISLEVQAVAG